MDTHEACGRQLVKSPVCCLVATLLLRNREAQLRIGSASLRCLTDVCEGCGLGAAGWGLHLSCLIRDANLCADPATEAGMAAPCPELPKSVEHAASCVCI